MSLEVSWSVKLSATDITAVRLLSCEEETRGGGEGKKNKDVRFQKQMSVDLTHNA